MTIRLTRRVGAGLIALAAVGLASPAIAGECRREGDNPLSARITEGRGVTDNVIGSIDLSEQIGVAGRNLRLRRLVVQPGGAVPFHSHDNRPALIITVSGSITEYRSTCAEPIEHRAGDVAREVRGISHYWVNNGREPAVLLSADVAAPM